MALINWPELGEASAYRDSGEGGLFAYAVWAPQKDECFVDVRPAMTVPDVLVRAVGPEASEFTEQSKEYNSLVSGRDMNYYEATLRSLASFGTVVQLGSTGASLYSEQAGDYFYVTREGLTEAGLALIETLEAVYGEATFVTYLDT